MGAIAFVYVIVKHVRKSSCRQCEHDGILVNVPEIVQKSRLFEEILRRVAA